MASCNQAARRTGAMEELRKLLVEVEAEEHPLPVFSRSCRRWFQGAVASSRSTNVNDYFCELRFEVPGVGLCRRRVHVSTLVSMIQEAMAWPAADAMWTKDEDLSRRSAEPAEPQRLERDPGMGEVGRGAAMARRAVDRTKARVKGTWNERSRHAQETKAVARHAVDCAKAKVKGTWMQIAELARVLKLGGHPMQHRAKAIATESLKLGRRAADYTKAMVKDRRNGSGKGDRHRPSLSNIEPLPIASPVESVRSILLAPALLTDRFHGQDALEVERRLPELDAQHIEVMSEGLLTYLERARRDPKNTIGGLISFAEDTAETSKGFRMLGEPEGECRTPGEAFKAFGTLGWSCTKGRHPSRDAPNQDSWCVLSVGKEFRLMVVADGFGLDGQTAADLAVELLPKFLLASGRMLTQWSRACFEAFQETHRLLVGLGIEDKWDCDYSGCSAMVVLHDIQNLTLRVAHVGNCGCCVGSRDGYAHQMLTQELTGATGDERRRVKGAGGSVEWDGFANRHFAKGGTIPMEQNPTVSRCLCHNYAHRVCGVIATPEVGEVTLGEGSYFLCLGSRGVWEFMESKDVIDLCASHGADLSRTAEEVRRLSQSKWIEGTEANGDAPWCSDITALVVRLQ